MGRYRIRWPRTRLQGAGGGLTREPFPDLRRMELLGPLMGGVTHSLNNVLAAILAIASTREALGKDPKDIEGFRAIGNSCKRGRELLKALMPFCKASPLDIQEREVRELDLRSLVEELRLLLECMVGKRIQVRVEAGPDPVWIRGDASALLRSFLDLCFQATEAMPNGGILWFGAAACEDGAQWVMETSLHDWRPRSVPEEMSALGGQLKWPVQPEEGTRLCVHFPGGKPRETVSSEALAGVQRILLVDDDPDVRFLVGRMLKAHGYVLETAESGEAALERLHVVPQPQLIILDEHMPGMDGQQTLAAIRAMNCHVPVLISSGHPEIEHWPAFQVPGVGVISKPFDVAELQAKIPSQPFGDPK